MNPLDSTYRLIIYFLLFNSLGSYLFSDLSFSPYIIVIVPKTNTDANSTIF
jgi:hypothetical protein